MAEDEIDAVASVPWLTWKSVIVKKKKVHYLGTSRQTLRRKELKSIEEKRREVAVSELNKDTSGRKEKEFIRQNKLNQWKEAVEKLKTILNCTISNDSSSMKNIEILKHRAVYLYLKNLIDGLNQGQSSVNAANIIWLGKASDVYRPKAIVGWAEQFLEYGIISPRRQGCHIKRQFFLADEDVKNAVIGWSRDQRSESLSLISLKKFIEESIVPEYLSVAGSVSEGTVRNYLHLWGCTYKPNNKDIYFDGHEREDVCIS
ncbi:hypothetical protein BDB01DRAFT_825675 [Pilobolus umbonatus]|nr:hypothetical protein BDB01DRAFT_825675 [Pilobolus umbonatus]